MTVPNIASLVSSKVMAILNAAPKISADPYTKFNIYIVVSDIAIPIDVCPTTTVRELIYFASAIMHVHEKYISIRFLSMPLDKNAQLLDYGICRDATVDAICKIQSTLDKYIRRISMNNIDIQIHKIYGYTCNAYIKFVPIIGDLRGYLALEFEDEPKTSYLSGRMFQPGFVTITDRRGNNIISSETIQRQTCDGIRSVVIRSCFATTAPGIHRVSINSSGKHHPLKLISEGSVAVKFYASKELDVVIVGNDHECCICSENISKHGMALACKQCSVVMCEECIGAMCSRAALEQKQVECPQCKIELKEK